MTRERFWRADYWLGETDARPLAIARVGLGLVVLQDLWRRAPLLRELLTDDGVLPRGLQTEAWAHGLFDLTGSYAGVLALFVLGALTTIVFTLGLYTRAATVATWLFWMSLQNRNLLISDGGDDVVRLLLFWSIFTDTGGVWSLDAWRGRGRARVPVLGARLMAWQLAAIYVPATIGKLVGNGGWLHGDAIHAMLQLPGFVRPPGEWLLQHPALCRLLTWSTLVFEAAIPILILSPVAVVPSRRLAIALNVGLQLGIGLSMRVGVFSAVMIVASAVLWPDRAPPPAAPPSRSPAARALAAILVAHMFLIYWFDVGLLLPRAVETELQWVGLNQPGDLFGRQLPVFRWRTRATLADGREIDLLPDTIPELQPSPGWLHTRWNKYTFKRNIRWEPLGAFLCREYNRKTTGARVTALTLLRDGHPPQRPGAPPPPVTTETLLQTSCD